MRLSNRNKAQLFSFINTLAAIMLFGGILIFLVDRFRLHYLGSRAYLLIVPILLGIYIYYRGRQIFEYDSDGEALNFKNRNVTPLLGKIASDEFPKYKLQKYEVVSILGIKKLYVTLSSKKNQFTTLKYDVSYLSSKEIKDLKFSLNKVVNANRESQPNEKTND